MDLNKMLEEIESLRKEMNEMSINRSLSDIELVKKSQELDKLLNAYHKLKNKRG